jgi:osmotically-inducible protein OsmY
MRHYVFGALASLVILTSGVAVAQVCAALNSGARCGFASSGVMQTLRNQRKDRSVRATVRRSWIQQGQQQSQDTAYTLEAGGQQTVGCTASDGDDGTRFAYRVVGCVVQ